MILLKENAEQIASLAVSRKKQTAKVVLKWMETFFGVNVIFINGAQNKGFEHCGMCDKLPCGELTHYIETGHNPNRLKNLKKWKEEVL